MARRIPWRRFCPDTVTERIEQASQARIYLLRETGPTGFLLKEDGIDRKFKVFLGDQHCCTCQTFSRERELCIHILWVLLKKFRVPKENPIIFQLSLVEREINEVMRGCYTRSSRVDRKNSEKVVATDNREKLKQKEIEEDDVCPICQDEFMQKPEPLTYCKYGCGNSVHIKCMKVWAEHQRSTGETIVKCPLCRVDFGTFQELMDEFHKSSRRKTRAERQQLHLGATCKRCRVCPISGKCYRCIVCADYHLCHTCFATDTHAQHSFQFRQKLSERWRPASRITLLPNAVMNNLQNRDITEADYELLLQLDRQITEQDGIPPNVIQNLPTEVLQETHRLVMDSSSKCGICLLNFQRYQCVRTLACRHPFHLSCIDGWLLNHAQCPVDGSYIGSVIASAPARLNARMLADSGDVPTGSNGKSLAGRITMGKRISHKTKLSGKSTDSSPSLPSNFTLSGSGLFSKLSRTPERETNTVEPPLLDGQHSLLHHSPSSVPQHARYCQSVTSAGTSTGIYKFMRHNLTFNPVNSKPPISPHSVVNVRSSSGDTKRPGAKLRQKIERMSLNNSQRSSSEGDLSLFATGTAVQRESQTLDSEIDLSRTRKAGRLVKGQPTSEKSRQSLSDPGLAYNSEPIIASGISVHLPPVD